MAFQSMLSEAPAAPAGTPWGAPSWPMLGAQEACPGGGAAQEPPAEPYAHPSASSNAPVASTGLGGPPQGAGFQPLGAQGMHGGLMQSMFMQGPGAPPAVQGGGAMGMPGMVGNVASGQQAGQPPSSYDQQAILFQLLATQHQLLSAQAGQFGTGVFNAHTNLPPLISPYQTQDFSAANPGAAVGRGDLRPAAYRHDNQSALLHDNPAALLPVGGVQGVERKMEMVFPRRGRKSGSSEKKVSDPVLITLDIIQRLFHLPLTEAARQLGLSPTAIKGACRRLGIRKWPFRTVTAKNQRRGPPKKPATGGGDGGQTDGLSLLGAAIEMDMKKEKVAPYPVAPPTQLGQLPSA